MPNTDRSWISNRVQNDKISLTPEYRNGVEFLLNFSREKGMDDNAMRKCPCKRCKKLKWLDVDEVRFHLLSKRMLESYIMWTSYGEVVLKKESRKRHH